MDTALSPLGGKSTIYKILIDEFINSSQINCKLIVVFLISTDAVDISWTGDQLLLAMCTFYALMASVNFLLDQIRILCKGK